MKETGDAGLNTKCLGLLATITFWKLLVSFPIHNALFFGKNRFIANVVIRSHLGLIIQYVFKKKDNLFGFVFYVSVNVG